MSYEYADNEQHSAPPYDFGRSLIDPELDWVSQASKINPPTKAGSTTTSHQPVDPQQNMNSEGMSCRDQFGQHKSQVHSQPHVPNFGSEESKRMVENGVHHIHEPAIECGFSSSDPDNDQDRRYAELLEG